MPKQKPAGPEGEQPGGNALGEALCGARLSGVLRAAHHLAITATDLTGLIQVFNSGAERMLGYTAEELVGKAKPDIFHLPSEVETYAWEQTVRLGQPVIGMEALVSAIRHGGPKALDKRNWTYLRKDGSRLPVELTLTGVYSETGGLEGFLGVAVDLSGHRALEAELLQAQLSVDSAGDMVFWVRAADGRYTYVNLAATRLLGFSRQELLGMTVCDLNPERTPENWRETVELLGRQSQLVWTGAFRTKTGSLLPVEFMASLIRHDDTDYVLGIVRDLTERRALEASLRQALVGMENVLDMIIWVRAEDRLLAYANRAACQGLGYSREELLGMPIERLNRARTPENWRQGCVQLRQEGQGRFEAVYHRKDGSSFHADVLGTMVQHEGEDYVVAVLRDITERKSLEASLRQAQISVDSAADIIIWVGAQDRRIAYVNRAASLELGYSAEELLGRRIEEINLARTPENWKTSLEVLRRHGSDVLEGLYRRRDGSVIPTELRASLVQHQGGEYVVAIVRDVSGRKALEAELRQAQVGMENVLDMIIWVGVEDQRLAYANRAACLGLGYSREELLGMPLVRLNRARTPDTWQEACDALRQRGRGEYEALYHRKDGGSFPVESLATVVQHEGREYVVAILRDVTRRKALEADLVQAQVSVNAAKDMISWVDLAEGRVAYVNESSCRLLGYSRQELLGAPFQLVNPARTRAEWDAMAALLRARGSISYEAVYRRSDGSSIPVETNASFFVHEGREYAVGIARDLTERKAQERRVELEARLNQSLAEAARALLGESPDLNAVAALLLERACELTGSRHGYVAFVDEKSGHMVPRAMSAMITSGECRLGQLPVTFPPGPGGVYPGLWGHSLNTQQGFFENSPAAHTSSTGLPQGHVPLNQLLSAPAVVRGKAVGQITLANPGRDYTQADLDIVTSLADLFALGVEQLQVRKAALEAKEEAEASSRAKSEFLANMTHEVRTPLNGILGMLQVLELSELSPEQQEHLGVARHSAERLALLLNNVIDYARLDTTPDAASLHDFPPKDLLLSLRSAFEPQAREKGLEFRLADSGLPEFMRSDPQILRQVLGHLLDNAVKFTSSGHVGLSAGLVPGFPGLFAFRVEDSGIGIPEELREMVFKAFVQADSSFTRTYGGAGLGLAIARKLTERLGGVLEALDRPGGGTVMLLTIPLISPEV